MYEPQHKTRIVELVEQLKLNRFDEGPLALIRKIRGSLLHRPKGGGIEVVAEGKADWIGWAELKTAPVDEIAVLNTGRVIRDVDADLLAVVEAENRVLLKTFGHYVVDRVNSELPCEQRKKPYTSTMLIDGNEDRGIDVGLMTKEGFDIEDMRSHVHDLDDTSEPIYSRDCPEYAVTTPTVESVWVLPNHFKSKFGGNDPDSIAKSEAQATRTAEIASGLQATPSLSFALAHPNAWRVLSRQPGLPVSPISGNSAEPGTYASLYIHPLDPLRPPLRCLERLSEVPTVSPHLPVLKLTDDHDVEYPPFAVVDDPPRQPTAPP